MEKKPCTFPWNDVHGNACKIIPLNSSKFPLNSMSGKIPTFNSNCSLKFILQVYHHLVRKASVQPPIVNDFITLLILFLEWDAFVHTNPTK